MRVSLSNPRFSAVPAQQTSLAGRVHVSPSFAATTKKPSEALQKAVALIKATKGLENFYEHEQFNFEEISANSSCIRRFFKDVSRTSKMFETVWKLDEPNSKPYQLLVSRNYKTAEKAECEFSKYVSQIKKRKDVKELAITDTMVTFKIIQEPLEMENFFLLDKDSNQTYLGQIIGLKNRHFK
ncbi:MAG: hypothetical protein QE263_03995 [Vampirovibrionales bacterium]|nr:hypothetical protein [Vampirovibrionales bacterium]